MTYYIPVGPRHSAWFYGYKVKLNVTAAGNADYSPVTRTVTFKIRVK